MLLLIGVPVATPYTLQKMPKNTPVLQHEIGSNGCIRYTIRKQIKQLSGWEPFAPSIMTYIWEKFVRFNVYNSLWDCKQKAEKLYSFSIKMVSHQPHNNFPEFYTSCYSHILVQRSIRLCFKVKFIFKFIFKNFKYGHKNILIFYTTIGFLIAIQIIFLNTKNYYFTRIFSL